jgi:hypothetical protein
MTFKKCEQEKKFILKMDERRRKRRVARQSCGFWWVGIRRRAIGKSGIESGFMVTPL